MYTEIQKIRLQPNKLVNNGWKLIQTIIYMGCTGPPKEKKEIPPVISSSAGILTITITNGVIFHQAGVFKMDPYLKLKLSNQEKTSKIVAKGGKSPNFYQKFVFYINSGHKIYGRNLQIVLMDKKKIGGDNFVGYGSVDLNPVIDLKKAQDQFRCILNYEYKEAGFVNIIAQFQEQPTEIINFRFEQAIIRRNVSTFGDANCWISVTIGQEIMKTTKHKDTRKKPPAWLNQVTSIKTLPSIKQCLIKVMDDEKEIGSFVIPMDKLISSEGEQSFAEDFLYEKGLYAGTLKFQTIKGIAHNFSPIDTNRSSIQQNKIPKYENYFGPKEVQTSHPAQTAKGK